MLKVSHLIPLIKRNLENTATPEFEDAKHAMAEEFLKCIREDYLEKAHGRSGAGGVQWEPTQRFLENKGLMLIKTGNLLDGFKIETTPTGFAVYNDVEYAAKQFRLRFPWPEDQLPAEWMKRILDAGKPYLVKAIARATVASLQAEGQSVVSEIVS